MHWRRFGVAKGGQRVVMVAEDERRWGTRNELLLPESREPCHVELLPECRILESLETGFKPLYHPRRLSFPNIPRQFSTRHCSVAYNNPVSAKF